MHAGYSDSIQLIMSCDSELIQRFGIDYMHISHTSEFTNQSILWSLRNGIIYTAFIFIGAGKSTSTEH